MGPDFITGIIDTGRHGLGFPNGLPTPLRRIQVHVVQSNSARLPLATERWVSACAHSKVQRARAECFPKLPTVSSLPGRSQRRHYFLRATRAPWRMETEPHPEDRSRPKGK